MRLGWVRFNSHLVAAEGVEGVMCPSLTLLAIDSTQHEPILYLMCAYIRRFKNFDTI